MDLPDRSAVSLLPVRHQSFAIVHHQSDVAKIVAVPLRVFQEALRPKRQGVVSGTAPAEDDLRVGKHGKRQVEIAEIQWLLVQEPA